MNLTLLPMVTFVNLVKKRNALSGIKERVVLGSTIDTILYIPSGMLLGVTPVAKAPFVLLSLADRSRATSFSPLCNANNNCVQPLSSVPIVPKSIAMGRGTVSTVCESMYSAKGTEPAPLQP
jgi:hypothetical protein